MTQQTETPSAEPPNTVNDPVDSLGSDSWIGADRYFEGTELHDRALAVLNEVNWDRLLSISSNLRNGTPCKFSQNVAMGHANMVRRIEFTDGINWVAKVRLPELKAEVGDCQVFDMASIHKLEVASMKFLEAKSSIPVPKVHAHSANLNNDVGARYILMDYIHGTAATDLRDAKGYEDDQFGTPDQDRSFRKQMAEIQVTLSTFKFDQIGGLYQYEETSEFFIGKDPETDQGPWKSSMEYYNDLVNYVLQVCVHEASPDVQTASSFANPILFKHLMSLYSCGNSNQGPFSLVNRDFGAHHLLVDDEFQIVGVIDFDCVMAAPIEVAAQYPVLTELGLEPPGYVETSPDDLERIRRTEPKLKEYKEMVQAAEFNMGINDKGKALIGDLLLSDAASAFQGLLRYQCHQAFVNDKWMDVYLKLIRERISLRT
ncbi:hypothetical protein IL306_003659 [Fusarium sp. DS 682]|nr:hypothetical protein IL306_003659 [Fusarium sp. DS 682]